MSDACPALGPVGVFDSGVGGLSVLRHLRAALPIEPVLYVADAAWCPYGPRPAEVVRARVFRVADHLVARGVRVVVVACNTASTVALADLRRRHPQLPFVGMEPAVKPAAATSATGQIGVLATATTVRGEALARLVDRYGRHATVHVAVPEGLVELVEAGQANGPAAEAILRPILDEWRARGVDVVVLGCTHYPFARATIERLAGSAAVIDPAPAVARQALRVLGLMPAPAPTTVPASDPAPPSAAAPTLCLTSGDPAALRRTAALLLAEPWVSQARYEPLGL